MDSLEHFLAWAEKYAKRNGVKVNQDLASIIFEGLKHNKERLGYIYCPCRVKAIRDNICPCKEMRETKHCHCGLFIKEE